MSVELENAKQFPKIFYSRHMQPGIVGYKDETILVDTDALKKMIPSFVGKPVYLGHRVVDLENLKKDASGYVTDSFYNELDGWGWVKFLAIDDDVYAANAKGWAVSNAYVPTQWGDGGTKNNCPYNREIMSGEFTHLAIVEDPRYEEACILTPDEFKIYQQNKKMQLNELQNSKTEKGRSMKFFKRTKEEVKEVDADTLVEITNDKGEVTEVSVKEMTDAILNAKQKMNADCDVTVGDEVMPLSELVNRYTGLKNKRNEKDEDEKKEKENESGDEEDKEKEKKNKTKKNESDEDKKDADKKEKENSKDGDEEEKKDFFKELQNANQPKAQPVVIDTQQNKLARGKALYGSNR